jgi:hypothetical protein
MCYLINSYRFLLDKNLRLILLQNLEKPTDLQARPRGHGIIQGHFVGFRTA